MILALRPMAFNLPETCDSARKSDYFCNDFRSSVAQFVLMMSFAYLARVTSAQRFDPMNHVFYLFIAHAREQREADKAAPGLGRHGAIFRHPSERFLVIGMQM